MPISLPKKSFTLIEMLIVIVIIGILAAALVPRLQDVQGRARDTKRKTDLTQISNALLMYHVDNQVFPVPNSSSPNCGSSSYSASETCHASSLYPFPDGFWISGMVNYLTSMPLDPINEGSTNQSRGPWFYQTQGYAYTSPYGLLDKFSLRAKLENPKDPDRCENQLYTVYLQTNQSNITCLNISPPMSSTHVTTGSLPQLYIRSYPK